MLMKRYAQEGDFARALGGGVVAGIVGGIVLSLIMAGMALASGGELWPALKGAGAPFLGERAFQPGFDPLAIVVGLSAHFAVSIFWGALFGALFFGLERPLTVLVGGIWGLVVWVGMHYVALPILGLGGGERNESVVALTHVIFGLAIGIAFLPFQVPKIRHRGPHRYREPVTP